MRHDIPIDEHGPLGPEMADAVSTCVHCGFCLAACPTYQELGQEADSPRGRIVLMKEVLEGSLPLEVAAEHLDPCLGCLACEPACPSGVPYGELISPFRSLTESQRRRSWVDRLRRLLVQSTLPFPGRMRMAAMTGRWVKPLAFLLPGGFRTMLELLPDRIPAGQSWSGTHAPEGRRRGRVALLTGCAQSVLEPDINTATIEVLRKNGVEVVVPEGQVCCGALSWHVGNHPQAQRLAIRNLQAFPSDVDAVVTNAAGCGSGMHEYPLILKGSGHESRAAEFADRVIDVSVYLDRLGELAPFPDSGRPIRVAYHDACHLANAQGVRAEPRRLLRRVPGLELLEIADGHLCCGSAGTYNIDHPRTAASLGRQKAEHVRATGAEIVVSGNIGCQTQLRTHLRDAGGSCRVMHTMQLLRDAYRSRAGSAEPPSDPGGGSSRDPG